MMNKDDVDSLLMPPPPPRLPKRQKTVSVEGENNNNNNNNNIGSSETRHPDSILIPAAASHHNNDYSSNNNNNNSGDVHSISPKPFSSGAKALTTNNSSNEDFFDAQDDNSTNLQDHNTQSKSTPLNTNNDESKKNYNKPNNNSPSSNVVSFRDIIGHGQAKLRLDEALLPLALPPDLAESVLTGIRASPTSILLHGPPGCGKTKLAKAVAGEAQAAFLSVGPSDILSKFVGESEASIRGLFQEARRKASKMESKCAVVFFDEIDALGRSRVDEDSGKMSQAGGDNSSRRVLAELLIQMTELSNDNDNGEDDGEEEYGGYGDDGDSFSGRSTISTGIYDHQQRNNDMQPSIALGTQVSADTEQQQQLGTCTTPNRLFGDNSNTNNQQQPKPRVIVVAATNRPEDCDPALLRRFAVRVLVGLPTRKDRKKIIKRLLVDVEHNITSSQLNELALATEGWSGSDLESMTREAVMAPVRETLRIAAVAKKKAVQQKCGGVESAQKTDEQKKAEDAQHNATRESLLNNFRNLRPVSSKDFEDGIAFFLGALEFGSNDKQAHYDSSSGSEDDMDGEDGEDEEDDKDDEQ